jgi:hypothetical protein
MRRPTLALTALVPLLLMGAAPAPKSRFERSVPLPSGTRFVLDADAGSVVVRGSARGDARVVATSSLEEIEEKYRIEVKQTSGEVRVVSRKKPAPAAGSDGSARTART